MHSQNGSRPIATNDLPPSTVMPKTNGDRSDYNNHQVSQHQIRTKDNGAPQGAFQSGTMKDRNLKNPIGQGLTANSRDNQGHVDILPAEAGATDEAKPSQPTSHFSMSNSAPSDTAELVMTNRALAIQQDLLTTWVRTVRMAAGTLMVKALLQQILEVCQECTNAEQGSLFLLNEAGAVSECLLARGATIREQKRAIVGRILDDGLAAWVTEHRTIGCIKDTVTDERWVVLPNQPYTVRSALCIPLQRGNRILGLVTLTHETPEYFSEECVQLMEKVSDGIALVLENAQLYSDHTAPIVEGTQDVILPPAEKPSQFLARALYITTAEGKLRYVNRKFATLFGYRRREIARMESILDLIPVDYQDQFVQQMQRCIERPDSPVECQISGRHRDGHLLRLVFYAERIHFARQPGTLGVVYVVPPPSRDSAYQAPEDSDLMSPYSTSDVSHFSGFGSEFMLDTDFGDSIETSEASQ
ncbi:MAG: GAF domain-containing protein [Cyanophyceae cyanobacterium]